MPPLRPITLDIGHLPDELRKPGPGYEIRGIVQWSAGFRVFIYGDVRKGILFRPGYRAPPAPILADMNV